ncbi:hypothetical protein KHQ08_00670 (plasmid) [Pseudochrobactrum algeriensis]|uniref:hypothetical protein n=1 Tax=Pseudochrobactrum algeriensis TaxID=2834768 RepID=UPI001BCF7E5B|nr:hypothetical protein [Pseudochrobactrum algeriensis]QVQ35442.1 hypothetical protein KHQ08_00670 [Pseudochrobactrum algeriensis]QVQ42057.1 hypothetical protein KHQ07_16540 [Pseudochrobactrum algeriensis]QVQ42315.1 hypothetical protein KHQ09_01335 [Pseudochrobactrum algeriensis]
MIPGKYSGLVTCFAAAGMGMFVAIWLLDFALIRTNWCSGAETVCLRDWLSALSGWAAAIATLITLRFIYMQIKMAASIHRENVNQQEAPHKVAAEKAIGHLRVAHNLARALNEQLRDQTENEDIYSLYGPFCLSVYNELHGLLNDPVFERLQAIDDRQISFLHQKTCSTLNTAIQMCNGGITRQKDDILIENELQRRMEARIFHNVLEEIVRLQGTVIDAAFNRFANLRIRD